MSVVPDPPLPDVVPRLAVHAERRSSRVSARDVEEGQQKDETCACPEVITIPASLLLITKKESTC